jgi:hypothetical protein
MGQRYAKKHSQSRMFFGRPWLRWRWHFLGMGN